MTDLNIDVTDSVVPELNVRVRRTPGYGVGGQLAKSGDYAVGAGEEIHPSVQRRSALRRPRGMNAMRTAATGATLLALAVATACGTSSRPAHSGSTPIPATVSAAASPSPASTPTSSP